MILEIVLNYATNLQHKQEFFLNIKKKIKIKNYFINFL